MNFLLKYNQINLIEFNMASLKTDSFKIIVVLCLTSIACESFFIKSQPVDKYEAEEVAGKSAIELIKLRGFRYELHEPRTKDGYYLYVIRIIHPNFDRSKLKRPVIFSHGLTASSSCWLINSRYVRPLDLDVCSEIPQDPKAYNGSFYLSGPFMLANFGYDVWLMSPRGFDDSLARQHGSKDPKQSEFWDFGVEEVAFIDVPTTIDYIRRITGAPKVGFIGHSLGTSYILLLLVGRPNYSEVVEPAIVLCPIAYIGHITLFNKIFFKTLAALSFHKNGPSPIKSKLIRTLLGYVCSEDKFKWLCEILQRLNAGKGENLLKGYFSHLPFNSSHKTFRFTAQHIDQDNRNGTIKSYDYGFLENLKRYNQTESPSYSVSRLRNRSVCIFNSRSDTLATKEDVDRLIRDAPIPLYRHVYIDEDFNHLNFLLSPNARQFVYKPLLEIMESFESNTKSCEQKDADIMPNPEED